MEKHKYTAKIFVGDREEMQDTGDDLEQLYEWMLEQAQGKLGDLHGEVIENKTKKVVRQFRKSPPD